MNKNIFKGVPTIFHRFQAASWSPMIKVCSLCLGISHANTLKCICAEENLLCLFAANACGHNSSIPFPRTRALCLAHILPQLAQGWDCTSPFIPISHVGFTALINWFHLPHIWQENFLITFLSPLRTWITRMLSIKLLPSLSLLKAPHVSRGQALSLASGKVTTKGRAGRHGCKAHCFSFLWIADNLFSTQNIWFSPAVNPT